MKKIPTIFERDWKGDRSRVIDKPHPDCGWVFAGEGWPTLKLDGTCCMVRDARLFKRREVKPGGEVPEGFELSMLDEETGKQVGWLPVDWSDPADKFHIDAFRDILPDGTYELVGPKIQGGIEGFERHELVSHDSQNLRIQAEIPRTFEGIRSYLDGKNVEGLVFHHPDGRMAKIKGRDFGISRTRPR